MFSLSDNNGLLCVPGGSAYQNHGQGGLVGCGLQVGRFNVFRTYTKMFVLISKEL